MRDFYITLDNQDSSVVPLDVISALLVDAKGQTVSLSASSNAETVYHLAELHNGDLSSSPTFMVTGANEGSGEIDPAVLNAKLNSTAAAPDWQLSTTYDAGSYITYDGMLFECISAYTTSISSSTPDNDGAHWKETDMTSPDATFDIMASGALRLMSSEGDLLWQQGYDLKTLVELSAGLSVSPSNEAVNAYAFEQDSTASVLITLPTTGKKAGDLIIDVSNPALGTEFLSTATYAVNDRVLYSGEVYRCSANVSTAGEWTGSINWEKLYSAFSSLSTYSASTTAAPVKVVYDEMLWECHTAITAAGDWTGTANWQTASFEIDKVPDSTSLIMPIGMNITEMLTVAPGMMCELYFTLTGFALNSKPTWKVSRQDVEAAL